MSSIVHFSDVFWVRNRRTILNGVNWDIRAGQHWAVLGLNGSGKTSLLNILNGYHWPTKGTVDILGKRLGTVDVKELRSHIGWVSASLADKIVEGNPSELVLNIVMGGRHGSIGLWAQSDNETLSAAREALAMVGCENFEDKPYYVLSQGQKQRVLLARAMISKLDLLVLDEPCTGLDIVGRELLLSNVEQLGERKDGPALIYVTHHTEEIMPCITHVLLLKDGSVAAVGPKEEVLQSSVLSSCFGIDVDVAWHRDRIWTSLKQTAQPIV